MGHQRALILTAAAVAAVVVFGAITLPPARRALPTSWADGSVAGVIHIHTNRSDGRSSPDEVAVAAARAGLRFIVFTDHGDATRAPDAPVYRSGVLCLDGVEISTTGGHYVALDMPASPYPLAGEARDVIEDVKRLGGFGIVAHPDSPKTELRWRDSTAPFDGIEALNPDTSWRQWLVSPGWRPKARLFEAFVVYPVRPPETIASLLQRSQVLSQWAALAERRRVVLLAGADAHARLGFRGAEPGDSSLSLPFPGYEAAFRTLSVHIRPDRGFSGHPSSDAAVVIRALRTGHLYTAIDGVASPPAFDFTATNDHGTVREGDELGVGGPVALRIRSNAPADFTTIVFNGASVVASDHHEQEFTVSTPGIPAVYRVEIWSPRQDQAAWLTSNPIYVRPVEGPVKRAPRPPATSLEPLFDGKAASSWRIEHDPHSIATVETVPAIGGTELLLRYALASGPASGQFVALVYDTPTGIAPNDRLAFRARAERPMRLSLQLRAPANHSVGERWQRSVYVDLIDQERTIYFDDLTAIGATRPQYPLLAEVRSILLVVDTTNTKPESSGRLWMKSAYLER